MLFRKNKVPNLRDLMPTLSPNPLVQFVNKVHRIILCFTKIEYVKQQVKIRGGECVNCGRCCKLVFQCPFLGGTEDNYYCTVYDKRPKPCQAFPLNERDLAEVDYFCGYDFPSTGTKTDLIQVQLPVSQPLSLPPETVPAASNSFFEIS